MNREILIEGLTFTECPRWHAGKLWFSDFYTKSVYSVTNDGECQLELSLDDYPAGLGWMPDGELRIISQRDRKLLGFNGSSLYEVADLSALAAGNCNDMVITKAGGAYIGNFGFDFHAPAFTPQVANLIYVSSEGEVSLAANEMYFPNGSIITKSKDGKDLLIVAESMGFCLTAFDINDDESLSNRRIFADFCRPDNYSIDQFSLSHKPKGALTPDGIALDKQGNIWVATIQNGLVKVTNDGVISSHIAFNKYVIACAVGADGSLYVCTTTHQSPDDCLRYKSASIERITFT